MSENKMATKADLMEFYSRIYPYLGVMPIGLANKFSKDSLYSTDEKIVGCWIDGRPIYQKTIEISNLKASANLINHGISNFGELVSIGGMVKRSDNNNYITVPFLFTNSNSMIVLTDFNTVSVTLVVGSAFGSLFDYANCGKLTVHYTKTTDAVNSFKYGDATDYSTTEKIVGTWVDGKPLYQKTFLNIPMVADSVNQGVFKGIFVSAQDGANLNLVGYEKLISHDSRYTPPATSLSIVGVTGTRNYSQQEVFCAKNVAQGSDKSIYIHERRNDAQDIASWETFDVTIQYTKTTD